MAFFKFRQRGQPQPEPAGRGRRNEAASAAPPDSIDNMRRRARHRLVGAAVLVLLAIIGFPLLFDTQPRPVAVNAPITIPDKDQMTPLRIPEPMAADAGLDEREEVVTSEPAARDSKPAAVPVAPPARSQAPAPVRDIKPEAKPDTSAAEARAKADAAAKAKADEAARAQAEQAAARARREEQAKAQREEERAKAAQARRDEEQAKAQAQAQAKREQDARAKEQQDARAKEQQEARAKREAEQRAKREEAARARALLEGRSPAATATAANAGGRFIVQVGAFADDAAVREARQKAERAGVRTYTQVVNTKDGPRTRVRVGPFGSREEADKAAAALKKAGLAGAVLSL